MNIQLNIAINCTLSIVSPPFIDNTRTGGFTATAR